MVASSEHAASSTRSPDAASGTPGGALLRALRERAGKPQLWVEAEADLGTGYLQRVESGRVVQPERGTVERVLDALGVPFGERRDVLGAFGYAVAIPLPTDAERRWARAASRAELAAVQFPAYVLDCGHRLVAWNAHVPRLFGVAPNGALMRRLDGSSMLAPWFDPASPLARLAAEPERFRAALVRALRFEMQAYRSEAWYAQMLDDLRAGSPLFGDAWERVDREPASTGAARLREPVAFDARGNAAGDVQRNAADDVQRNATGHGRDRAADDAPGAGLLRFRLSAEPFVRDARFRAIYYVPADAHTMAWCAAWETDEPATSR